MADNLPEPKSRTESYLAKAAGEDVTIPEKPESRLEQYLAAIAEGGGGGGGGTTYTAGDNIQISADNVISATDTTYTAGSGIDITSDVISATNTGKAKTLSSADFDYPTNNPDGVALWKLPAGIYIRPGTLKLYIRNNGSTYQYPNDMLIVSRGGDWNIVLTYDWSDSTGTRKAGTIYVWDDANYNNFRSGYPSNFLLSSAIIDNLNGQRSDEVLSANQGRVLKALVDGLVITGSGAPTTSTTGTVGQLYEDTTNGKLYQCTDATNPYVWSEVGAGGGGSAVTILTHDDYDFPANNPNSLALWNLDTGFYMIDPNSSGPFKASFGFYDTRNMSKGESFVIVKNKHPDANWSNFYQNNLWINFWGTGAGINTSNYFDTDANFLTRKSVKNDLTSTNTNLPLSANQGKELNDKITPTSGSGAPTTSTVGILGKIYVDTATDTAYMCTKVDSAIPEYTWKQITS